MATVETRQDVHIDLHYLTRIEGHGHLRIDTRRGDIERCELNVVEAPRFLEAMLVGRPHAQAPHLASRICGICSVSHTTASVRAVEKALGIEVSPQTEDLRKLAFYGEILDSHILHAYLLVAPDFFGQPSAIALAGEQPEVVTRALRMKRLAGDLCAVLAGRHTHPISIAVGGFRHLPTTATVAGLLDRLVEARADVAATLDLFRDLSFPPLNRETEVLALRRDDEYAFIDGDIACSDGGRWPVDRYAGVVEEHVVSHSTAKHSRHARNPYMVTINGALAVDLSGQVVADTIDGKQFSGIGGHEADGGVGGRGCGFCPRQAHGSPALSPLSTDRMPGSPCTRSASLTAHLRHG